MISRVQKGVVLGLTKFFTIAPIKVKETRTYDPMVVLQAKAIQQSSRNIFLRAAVCDTVRKQIVPPIQEMKKEHMDILKQNKVRLENYVSGVNTRKTPDSISGIYITAVKFLQYRMVDGNSR